MILLCISIQINNPVHFTGTGCSQSLLNEKPRTFDFETFLSLKEIPFPNHSRHLSDLSPELLLETLLRRRHGTVTTSHNITICKRSRTLTIT